MNGKVLNNFVWSFLEKLGVQVFSFFISIILARLLDPNIYGTLAIVTVFVSISEIITDAGLGCELVRDNLASDLDFNTNFWANLVICIFLYFLLFLFAPLISNIYNDQTLILYIRIYGITILLSGIKNIQHAYVFKKMKFKTLFFSSLLGTVFAGFFGVYLAFSGKGIWALIAQEIIDMIIDAIALFFCLDWKPKFEFSFDSFRKTFNYSWKMMVSFFANSLGSNIRQLLIGKVYTTVDLAYFNRGNTLPNIIAKNITNSFDQVLLPTMSEKQENDSALRGVLIKSIRLSALVMCPLMLGFIAISYRLVIVLLTEKWVNSAFFMNVYCLYYLCFPFDVANMNVVKAKGKSEVYLKINAISNIASLIIFIATAFIGVKAIAYGVLITGFITLYLNTVPSKQLLDFGMSKQLKESMPFLLSSTAMAISVYFIGTFLDYGILSLLIQIIAGVAIYALFMLIIKPNEVKELLTNIGNIKNRK